MSSLLAAVGSSFTLKAIIAKIIATILSPAVPILIGVAVVLFFFGLIKYLNSGFGDTKTLNEARGLMIWGIIAITAMVSVWGLANIMQGIFLGDSNPTTAPIVPYRYNPDTFDTDPINSNCEIETDPNCPNY